MAARVFPLSKRLRKKRKNEAGIMNKSRTAFARLADQARRRIEEISPDELARAKPSTVIIDVRESAEYADGYVARAKHVSRGVLEQQIAEVVPDFSTPIVLYCDRGERAALAAENLIKMGYRYVRSLQGGLQNWLESGGELEISRRFRQRQ
jgi:rhodanese-related sulfurtransferase